MINKNIIDNECFDDQIKELLKGLKTTEEEISSVIDDINQKYKVPVLRICSYGRVSTKSDEQESSLVTQHILFNKYVNSNRAKGYVLVEEIYDQKTGTLAVKRAKFIDMIKRAKDGEFDILLFKDAKRMCRNTGEFLEITEDLKRHNIACIFISEGLNSLTADRTTLTVIGMVAESHSNGLHDSVTIAKRINMEREKGRCPSYCFGYNKPNNNDSSEMYINEEEAKLVRELFERYVNLNEGVATICADWRLRGIKSKLGNTVSTTMLNRIIDNKIYTGELQMGLSYKKDVRDVRHYKNEPDITRKREDLRIISDELFYKAKEKRDNLKYGNTHMKGINRKTILSGKIECGCCGKHFKKFYNGKDKGKMAYYKCSTKKQTKREASGISCENQSCFRKDEILDSIEAYFQEILKNRDDIREIIRDTVSRFFKYFVENTNEKSLIKDIDNARQEFKRYQNLYLEGLLDDISLVRDKKTILDNFLARQLTLDMTNKTHYDVDSITDKFYNEIERFIKKGIRAFDESDLVEAVRFNNLFDSIIATEDGRLIFNMKMSDQISTLANTDSGTAAQIRAGCGYHLYPECRKRGQRD